MDSSNLLDTVLTKFEITSDKDYEEFKHSIVVKCPTCGKNKLWIWKNNQSYYCFYDKCGTQGVLKVEDVHIDKKLSLKIKSINIKSIIEREKEETKYRLDYYSRLEDFPDKVRDYLIKERGLSEFLIKKYNIMCDPYRDSIILPNKIIDEKYTDFYITRFLDNPKFRYKYPFKSVKTKYVYNLHNIKENSTIIITEGCFSSIFAGENSVAIYGKILSSTQLHKILDKKPRKIYLSLDYDALQYSLFAAEKFSNKGFNNIYITVLERDKDPADIGTEAFHNTYIKDRSIKYNKYTSMTLFEHLKEIKKQEIKYKKYSINNILRYKVSTIKSRSKYNGK